MENLTKIIELLATIQLVLVCILLLAAYGLKLYYQLDQQRIHRITMKLRRLLNGMLHSQQPIKPRLFKPYKKQQAILLKTINQFDAEQDNAYWLQIRTFIIEQILLPNAVRDAYSKQWTKRYLACQAFKLAITPEHEKIITHLVGDPVLIIAIHAALIAVRYDSQSLLDSVIDSFAKNRHIQQSLYAQLMLNTHPRFAELVHHRLLHETDPYIKAFCYRMLSSPAFNITAIKLAFHDAQCENVELRIAAMLYLHTHSSKRSEALLVKFLTDTQWEVRAKAAKLLGKSNNPSFVHALTACLQDEEWWVRLSAAEALAALGPKGLAVLAEKTATGDDPFAHDMAKKTSIITRAHHD